MMAKLTFECDAGMLRMATYIPSLVATMIMRMLITWKGNLVEVAVLLMEIIPSSIQRSRRVY